MDQIVGIVDSYVAPRVSGALTFARMVAPRFGMAVDEAATAAAVEPARAVIAEVARLLGDQPFMAGEAISLADLMIAPHFVFLPHFAEGRALLDGHAELSAWIDRVAARPSMAATEWERLLEIGAAQAAA